MKAKLLLLALLIAAIAAAQTSPCDRSISASKFPEDTTIVTKSGHIITMNRCEYFDVRNCISIRDLSDTSILRQMGVTMQTLEGRRLISSGMVQVSLDSCAKKCMEVPIVIKIRERPSPCNPIQNKLNDMYEIRGNSWVRLENSNVWYETIDGVKYLCYKTRCGGPGLNSDKIAPNRSVKLKVPRKYKITQYEIFMSCPTFYDKVVLEKIKRKVKMPIICASKSEIRVQLKLWDKTTETTKDISIILQQQAHVNRKLFCDIKNEWNLGFLGKIFFYKRNKNFLYKKYFLYIK